MQYVLDCGYVVVTDNAFQRAQKTSKQQDVIVDSSTVKKTVVA